MKITLAAGESKPVTMSGSQFYYMSGLGKIDVKLVSGGNARTFELSPGMGFRNNDGDLPFYGVEIKNIHSGAQDVEFEISYREVFDRRVIGSVDVFDSLRRRTESASAFLINRLVGGQGAAVYSNVAIRNPVASGKNVFVQKIIAGSTAALDMLIMKSHQLAVDETNAAVTLLSPGGFGVNKLIKNLSLAPSAVIDQFASTGGAFGALAIMARVYTQAQSVYTFELREPIKLEQGAGLVISCWNLNTPINATFEFYEESL